MTNTALLNLVLGMAVSWPTWTLSAAADVVPESGPAQFYPETVIVENGRPQAAIVYSDADQAAAEAAGRLARELQRRAGVEFPSLGDRKLCPEIMTRLPDEYRGQHLIVAGNLHNHNVVFPLYVNFLCGADSAFPGDGGYELRTISNPWGTGKNVILIGGSTAAGLEAGVDAFLAGLPAVKNGNLVIPRLHEVKPGRAIKAKFDWIAGRLDRSEFKRPAQPCEARPHLFTLPAMHYHWTGDGRWGAIAREALAYFNEIYDRHYPLGHYDAEAFFRAWDYIEESGLLDDEQRQVTARRMVETAWRIWPIGNTGGIGHVGNTHGTMKMMTQWVANRWMQRAFPDDAALQAVLLKRENQMRDFFAVAQGGTVDDNEGITSFQLFVRWSAMEQEPDYFQSGLVRQGLLYTADYYDSLGYQAGTSLYGGSRPGAMRSRQGYWCESYLFRLAAFIYQDPELIRLAHRFSEYGPPDVWAVMDLATYGAGTYPPPAPPEISRPMLTAGLHVVPFDARRYRLWNTGAPTRGVPAGQRMPPLDQMFDKVCLRNGFAPQDQYLLLEGLRTEADGANSIVRYTDQGQIWLTHNTAEAGPFVRNSLFISDGMNDRRIQSGSRLDAAGRFDGLSMFSGTLLDFYESDWQRVVFWKPGAWHLVLDRATTARAGQYAAQSIWRLPPISGIWQPEQRLLAAVQGGKQLMIQAAEPLPVTARREAPEGGMPDIYENPFILREYKSGFYPARQVIDFQNLLAVSDAEASPQFTLERVSGSAALVRGPGNDYCLAGVFGGQEDVLGMDGDAGLFAATPRYLYLAGTRILRLDGEIILDAPGPIALKIDLETGAVHGGYGVDTLRQAALTWELPPPAAPVAAWPAAQARRVGLALAERIGRLEKSAPPGAGAGDHPEAMTAAESPLNMQWESAAAGLRGKSPDGLHVRSAGNGDGEPTCLTDGITPARAGAVIWRGPNIKAEIELAWENRENIKEIRVHTGKVGRRGQPHQAPAAPAAGRDVVLSWSNDGFQNDIREQVVSASLNLRVDPVYKGETQAHQYLRIPCGGVAAAAVRLSIPRAANDWPNGILISEIEVSTERRGPLPLDQLLVTELEPGAAPSIIVTTEAMELALLDADGRERWRKSFAGRVPSVFAADITGDGCREIVWCSYDMQVYACDRDGRELWKTSCVDLFKKTGGKTGLNGSTPFAVGIWEPRPGLRRIVVGQYASPNLLLNPEGEMVGLVGMGGYTPRSFFAQADLDHDGLDELYLSSILYRDGGRIQAHVVDHDGRPLAAPPYTAVPAGTPFVARLLENQPGYAAVIAPGGAGVYNLNPGEAQRGGYNAVWESCNRPLSAGLVADIDGDGAPEILAGGRDGFVTIFDIQGVPSRSVLVGEEIKGILVFGAGKRARFVIATPRHLSVFDARWSPVGQRAGNYASLRSFRSGRGEFLAVTEDGQLQLWSIK